MNIKQKILKEIEEKFSTKSRPLYANFDTNGNLVSVKTTSQLREMGVFIGINYKRYISLDKSKSIFFYNKKLFNGFGFSYLMLFDCLEEQYIIDEKQLNYAINFLKRMNNLIANQSFKNIKYIFKKEKDIAFIQNISDLKNIFKNDEGEQLKYFWIEGKNLNSGIDFKNDILAKGKETIVVDGNSEIDNFEDKIFILRINSALKSVLLKHYLHLKESRIEEIIDNNKDNFNYKFKRTSDGAIVSSKNLTLKKLVEKDVLKPVEAISLAISKESFKYSLYWGKIDDDGIEQIKQNAGFFVFDDKKKALNDVFLGNSSGIEKALDFREKRVMFKNLNFGTQHQPNTIYTFKYQNKIIVTLSLKKTEGKLIKYKTKIEQKIKSNNFISMKNID